MTVPTNDSPNFNEASLNVAMESNILKEKMRRAAAICATALLQFYSQSGNSSQERSMKYLLKDLLYSQTEETEYLCETIYDHANINVVEAMKYGYSSADLAELRNSISQYRIFTKTKRKMIGNKKRLEEIIQDFPTWSRRVV